jgi:hypothetical protein
MAYADSLTERMDSLADALRAAGVPDERISSVLGSAATAAMHALVLDGVVAEARAFAGPQPRPERRPAAEPEPPVRLAA